MRKVYFQMKKALKNILAILVLTAAFALLLYYIKGTSAPELHGLYDVVRVVDGDTIIVDINGTETRVRLIGIDTPESVNPDTTLNTEQGKSASDFTSALLTGKQVYLEYDEEMTDKYGRTLAYVFLSDKTMVEEELLRSGMAEVLTIEPNSKYASYFEKLEEEAKRNGSGFWSDQ